MIVLDSNAVIHCINEKKRFPHDDLIVPDDLQDEYEVIALRHGRHKLPRYISASDYSGYDEVYYIQRYAHYLNSYSEVYLARMSGLADVAILALVDCLVNDFGSNNQLSFDLGDIHANTVTVITDDDTLQKRLTFEFDEVSVISSSDL